MFKIFKKVIKQLKDNNYIYKYTRNGKKRCFFVKGLDIKFSGRNSVVEIGSSTSFKNSKLSIGNNNIVKFGEYSQIHGLNVPIKMSDGSSLIIGKNFSCIGVKIYLHDEKCNQVVIGDDCLFSFDIVIWPSDGHSIFSIKTKKIINKPSLGIFIGNHCWICRAVSILKDSKISTNSIVGACSVVKGIFLTENCVLAGVPAKVIKENVNWDNRNTDSFANEIMD